MNNQITAIVSVYNPNPKIVNNINAIGEQVNRIIICDNSTKDNKEMFLKNNFFYFSKHRNLGLPGAFNSVLKDSAYRWEADEFVIFFDQDSQINDGYISGLVSAYIDVEKKYTSLGCMGPVFYNTSNQTLEVPHIKTELIEKNYKVDNVITSSMITRYRNLKKIGFWNDNLFLDFADWDLCWRMEKAGLMCVITENVVLHHSVGSGQKKIGPVHLRVGAPFREYYQTRDVYYLLKEDYIPPKMKLRLLANVTIRPVVHLMFLDDKDKRRYFIKKGKKDYEKGIKGELHY